MTQNAIALAARKYQGFVFLKIGETHCSGSQTQVNCRVPVLAVGKRSGKSQIELHNHV